MHQIVKIVNVIKESSIIIITIKIAKSQKRGSLKR